MADPGLAGPATNGASVTPNDNVNLSRLTRAIYVGGAGDLNVDLEDGVTLLFVGIPAGSLLPLRARRIRSTSTTATNVVALW